MLIYIIYTDTYTYLVRAKRGEKARNISEKNYIVLHVLYYLVFCKHITKPLLRAEKIVLYCVLG